MNNLCKFVNEGFKSIERELEVTNLFRLYTKIEGKFDKNYEIQKTMDELFPTAYYYSEDIPRDPFDQSYYTYYDENGNYVDEIDINTYFHNFVNEVDRIRFIYNHEEERFDILTIMPWGPDPNKYNIPERYTFTLTELCQYFIDIRIKLTSLLQNYISEYSNIEDKYNYERIRKIIEDKIDLNSKLTNLYLDMIR